MSIHDLPNSSSGAEQSQKNFNAEEPAPPDQAEHGSEQDKPNWLTDLEQTLQLGDQFLSFAVGVVDLARVEALLAMRTLPKLIMLWLLMLPILMLTWAAFSALAGWAMYAASDEVGLGLLMVFMMQVLLLLVCRWFIVKYRKRLAMPYTRAQINSFMRSTSDESSNRSETKE